MMAILMTILEITVIGCRTGDSTSHTTTAEPPDPHSFSLPQEARTTHLNLDIQCDFEHKLISGTADYTIEHQHADQIILDLNGPVITGVAIADEAGKSKVAHYYLGKQDSILGSPLIIDIFPDTRRVIISFHTSDNANALQWLDAAQTSNRKMPFLLTQSQSIYARSWIPCQDGPGVRFSYDARLKVPAGMMAVMSASNPVRRSENGVYEFHMNNPIPAYLMALAVGDFDFKAIDGRTGVYAEPAILDSAAWEFADLGKMVTAAEQLYGPYAWERYDVIVLPSGFPFGGMENPRMTFLTPTVIAGDRSLTSLLAHELAHSWSGNLVTNATWEDFWLNEGFTTYFENRIMESLYGKSYADMLSLLGYEDLLKSLKEMGEDNPLTKLKLNLRGINPEEALTDIAYEKGKNLLRYLEERLGRAAWDPFLKSYFNRFRFGSNTTEGFLRFLDSSFVDMPRSIRDTVDRWIYAPGLIRYQPAYDNSRFLRIEEQAKQFIHNPSMSLKTTGWSTHEWLHFLRNMGPDSTGLIALRLQAQFDLDHTRNAEIAFCWLNYLIDNGRGQEHLIQISHFLQTVGRRKFVQPIYENLVKHGLSEEAATIYRVASPAYHPLTRMSVEEILQKRL